MPRGRVPTVPLPTEIGAPPHSAFLRQLLRSLQTFAQEFALQVRAGPFHPASYETADRPPAADHPGGLIYVPNAAAGSKLQYSDGTSWIPYA